MDIAKKEVSWQLKEKDCFMKNILISSILFLVFSSYLSSEEEIVRINPVQPVALPIIQPAPDFMDIQKWLNSAPIHIDSLTGKVVLVDFWTYSCINCIRTLPYLKSWNEAYKDKGLVIIGIHSPEFRFEHDVENVKKAISNFGITYPVALDNNLATWKAYGTKFWPTQYLIDQNGRIRKVHIGEGDYQGMENAIRSLLGLGFKHFEEPEKTFFHTISHEVYLGFRRANRYTVGIELEPNTINSYNYSEKLLSDEVGIKGLWRAGPEGITSAGTTSQIDLNFLASRVYLILGGVSQDPIKVLLDHAPLAKEYYTADLDSRGQLFVREDKKYDIINLHGKVERHTLTLMIPPGITAYAFTFGAES